MKPGPWRITFDTNPDDCNLRCIMCEGFSPYSSVQKERSQQGKPRRRMDIGLIARILDQAKGSPLHEIIPSTMGEPLLYKHFDELIHLCHHHKLKLNLTTNGTFPGRSVEEWAAMLVPVLSDVKISWNGSTQSTHETIMRGSRWEKVLANIKTFIRIRDAYALTGDNRCTVTLQLTFLTINVNELADIVRLGIDLGVDRIKGHHLWTHFTEIKNLSLRSQENGVTQWNQAVHKAHAVSHDHLLPNGQRIKLENFTILDSHRPTKAAYEDVCPFLGQEAWIDTEGRFSPCCAPDKERRTLGDFGNVKETSLEAIWNSKPYQELQRTYKEKPLCQGCTMRKPQRKIAEVI